MNRQSCYVISFSGNIVKYFWIKLKLEISKKKNASIISCDVTVADWDSMGRVIMQTRDRVFQTLGRAFSFLLNPQKLGWAFQRLGRMFWNKCFAESFD